MKDLPEDYWQKDSYRYAIPCMMPIVGLDQYKDSPGQVPPLLFASESGFFPLDTFQRLIVSCSSGPNWRPHGTMYYNVAEFKYVAGTVVLVSLVLVRQCIALSAKFLSEETAKAGSKMLPDIADTVWRRLKAIEEVQFCIFVCPYGTFDFGDECLVPVRDLTRDSQKSPSKGLVRRLMGSSSKTRVADFPTSTDAYHDATCPLQGHRTNRLSTQEYAVWFCGSVKIRKSKSFSRSPRKLSNSPDEIFLEFSKRIASDELLFTTGIKLGLLYHEVQAVRTINPTDIQLAGLAMVKEWQSKTSLNDPTEIASRLKKAFSGDESRILVQNYNQMEAMLWTCSRKTVSQDLLYGIGISVRLPCREVEATLANNPHDIQLAAFRMLVKSQIMWKWTEAKLRDILVNAFEQLGVSNVFD